MSVKLLNEHHLEFLSLKEGCTGSSESALCTVPHCWKTHVTAQLYLFSLEITAERKYILALDILELSQMS